MNILVLAPELPMDSRKGFQVLSFHRLVHLAKKHRIVLITYASEQQKKLLVEKLNCPSVSVTTVPWKPIEAAMRVLIALFSKEKPLQCAAYESREYRRAVADAVRHCQPDLIYGVTIRSLYASVLGNAHLVVDLVDSMALNLERRLPTAPWWQRPLMRLEYARVKDFEKRVSLSSQRSFIVSRIDKATIGDDRIVVLPLGVDTREFHPKPMRTRDLIVTFTGNMRYAPNVEAVLWFYRACWPQLADQFPDLQFMIAGSNPASDLRQLAAEERIHVTGRVDSMAAVLQRSTIAIAPMQSGSGMQFKILEAMGCGLPVVTTRVGLGDVAAVDGEQLLVADSPHLFTSAIARLLQSETLRENIGAAAAKFIRENHSWGPINEKFENEITVALEAISARGE
jgi:glycosyltransferase involved in cell wall biosynthesis